MIETLEKTKFDTLKDIADLNVKVSEARNTLLEIEKEKESFIAKREKQTVVKITKVVKESEEMLSKATNNYEQVNTLVRVVTGYTESIREAHEDLKVLVKDYSEKNTLWEKNYENQVHSLSHLEKRINDDKKALKKEFSELAKQKELLGKQRIKLEDEKETIKRSIKRLKKGKI